MGQQRKKRRRFSAAQKVSIIREHLLDGRPVSDLCDEYDLNPNMFYRWQKQFFESGHVVFERTSGDPSARKAQKKVEKLEQKLQQKDMVLGEVMAEYVAVKKKDGDS